MGGEGHFCDWLEMGVVEGSKAENGYLAVEEGKRIA